MLMIMMILKLQLQLPRWTMLPKEQGVGQGALIQTTSTLPAFPTLFQTKKEGFRMLYVWDLSVAIAAPRQVTGGLQWGHRKQSIRISLHRLNGG